MSHFDRLVLTLAIIFISLTLGWLCRQAAEKGKLPVSQERLEQLRHFLQTVAIFGLLPLSAMLSLWGLPQPEPELLILPLLGLVAYIWGGSLAVIASRLLKLNRKETGSYFCCGTFTNIGAVGGLVCLLFLGENSIALVALYRLVEEIYYFSIAFPIAHWYGEQSSQRLSFRAFKFNPVLAVVVSALLMGIILNLVHIPRPELFGFIASASMLIATVFFLFAIGLTLRLSSMGGYFGASLGMCLIKFIGIPCLIIPLAWLLGFGDFEDALPLKTVAILCSMPVAMTALIPPSLFKLDVDLANACWIFTTLGIVAVLPMLMLLLPQL